MLGFSIGKLIVTAVIILFVWYGFKFLSRGTKKQKQSGNTNDSNVDTNAEELNQCSLCGLYVSSNINDECNREGCPNTA